MSGKNRHHYKAAWERERERERERHTHTHTHTNRDTHTHTLAHMYLNIYRYTMHISIYVCVCVCVYKELTSRFTELNNSHSSRSTTPCYVRLIVPFIAMQQTAQKQVVRGGGGGGGTFYSRTQQDSLQTIDCILSPCQAWYTYCIWTISIPVPWVKMPFVGLSISPPSPPPPLSMMVTPSLCLHISTRLIWTVFQVNGNISHDNDGSPTALNMQHDCYFVHLFHAMVRLFLINCSKGL